MFEANLCVITIAILGVLTDFLECLGFTIYIRDTLHLIYDACRKFKL